MSESGAHSQRILAIVVIFFSSYIVGIYSAARASSQLLQLQQRNHSLLNETHLDALDAEAEAGLAVNGSELALARNGTRNPRCKYLRNELKCEQVKVSLTALRRLLLQSVCFVVFVVGLCMYVGHTSIITQCAGSVRDSLVLGTLWHRTRPYTYQPSWCSFSPLSQIASDWFGSERKKSFPL